MNISVSLATNILNKMKEIIHQDLNYIDKSGIIIASTAPDRTGTFHAAGLKSIKEKTPIIINSDDEFHGSRKGINMPIYFNDTIVGAIGISGDKNEVEKYGEIIKMMTEILIKEAWIKDSDIRAKEINRTFIERIVLGYDYDFFPTTDFTFPYAVVVGKLNKNNSFLVNDKIYDILKNSLSHNKNNIYTISRNEIIILYHFYKDENISKTIFQLQEKLLEKTKLDFRFGIGTKTFEYSSLKESYKAAKEILNFMIKFSIKKSVSEYEKMDLEFIFLNLKKSDIENFTNRILKNFTPKEIEEFSLLMNSYEENNGSILHTSEALFMHKNTLQYKLNKIKQLSGYDPRHLKDFIVLSLAFKLQRNI
ncbi:hypothetical protein DW261_02430 [Fusobacterium varium]|uniref:CdaR family transcriptional regulator n=1 Tax=Fusobacterium varium TaxID=856 RepID=UPI000E4E290B|nr:sugar diacid recognition domain-containing protein [Fusobacterium varium]RHG37847.1 hypothetical protein DW261_02430 [Fusobacterium varium]